MSELDLTNVNGNLPEQRTKQILTVAVQFDILPSLMISQLYLETFWGTTNSAVQNNNWGGSSFFYNTSPYTRPSGVVVERGTARPSSEGAYYMKFETVEDYFYDYGYLLAEQGIYKVKGIKDFDTAIKGLFRAGGATADYAAMPWNEYVDLLRGIRAGINNRNNNILNRLDENPKDYIDEIPPEPEPPVDDDDDFEGLDLYSLFLEVQSLIKKMLGTDVFKAVNSGFYSNHYIQLMNQLENTYKVNAKKPFFDEIEQAFEDFNDDYKPDPSPDPDPDPSPDPSGWVFPVKQESGINFWKRSNWGVGTLQRNMTYGTRSSGRFHAGYDIGGGGRSHDIYALADATITDIRWVTGGGYSIFMNHTNDKYHSLYLHLQEGSALVSKGDTVKAGQKIARMGATGGNYAIHLHVEISETGKFHTEANTVNPEPLLKITGDNKTALPKPS